METNIGHLAWDGMLMLFLATFLQNTCGAHPVAEMKTHAREHMAYVRVYLHKRTRAPDRVCVRNSSDEDDHDDDDDADDDNAY